MADVAKPAPIPAPLKKADDKQQQQQQMEMTEEDRHLQESLEMLVERLVEPQPDLHRPALEALRTIIRSSTSSMTSVPKPLKFLRARLSQLRDIYANMIDENNKNLLSDILSVLCMAYGEEGKRETLHFRLAGSAEPASSWGHEYVRHLAMEIMKEYAGRVEESKPVDDLHVLCKELLVFFLEHNAEADACDLAIEVELLPQFVEFVNETNYSRISLYLSSCVSYEPYPDDVLLLKTIHSIYLKVKNYPKALMVAMKLADPELILSDYTNCPEPVTKKQLAFLLARQRIAVPTETNEDLQDILNNTKLSAHYHSLAKEFSIMEPKTPEEIYKSHLENVKYPSLVAVDSAKQSLASAFVNAFVNAGFGKDKLVMTEEEPKSSIYQTKEHGLLASVASIGMIKLWDVDMALSYLDKYLYSTDDMIKAGALLAIGMVTSGVDNEADPALALLSEYIGSAHSAIRISAIMGLGIAYCGTLKESVLDLLLPIISDYTESTPIEVLCFATLSLGLVFVGSCHGEISSSIIQLMMEKDEAALRSPFTKFMSLGLALLFLGRQEASETILETLKVVESGSIGKEASTLVKVCSYASTGNVLKIQECLHLCTDHLDASKESDAFQAFAVLGLALIAGGEDVGSEMVLRTLNHLMHYGEPVIRRAVPLALALLCASHPKGPVLDTLSKYSHDHDAEVAMCSIFALGLVGAGTNNARLGQMLRQLASYYHRDNDQLFLVRIAQGLVHAGKGLLSINPLHSDRSVTSPIALAGLLTVLVACTSVKELVLGKYPHVLYYLVTAMYPRFLLTMDEHSNPLNVTVRVGQAVDVVGQAGRPKTITGFQTHATPVLLAYSERAELATEQYLPLSEVLEGFVILKKNPEYQEDSSA